MEQLETRRLMAEVARAAHNSAMPEDVNADAYVTAYDALAIVNKLNLVDVGTAGEGETSHFLDVSNDSFVTPLDALLVINHLNRLSGGEHAMPPEPDDSVVTEANILCLLERAARATTSQDAIIAVVDRSGRILGVRVEQSVLDAYVGRDSALNFAIDGAVAKARTAAFFSNNQAPLTSRTIRFISQSTITQREVQSNPNVPSMDSSLRGPGFVAPIGVAGHFPPGVNNTPLVDLFAIEHQSRDSSIHAGPNGIKEGLVPGSDDIPLAMRFDVDAAHVPAEAKEFMKTFPESYGFQSGRELTAQGRGIATLPGGMPLYKQRTRDGKPELNLVGGIGVFFPGPDGFATFEQDFQPASTRGSLGVQPVSERLNAPKVLEAEFIAYFAAGGTVVGPGFVPVTQFEGLAPICAGFGMPSGRIDLVGITLEIFGPHPTRFNPVTGAERLIQVGSALGGGTGLNSGLDMPVKGAATVLRGHSVPEGWLVNPHASAVDAILGEDVERIIRQGIDEANLVRAAIRLDVSNNFKPGVRTKMVFAVTDSTGEVLGLYRMKDATVFSVDVAVAKARNTAYYAGASLAPADYVDTNDDSLPDVPVGTAFTNRTFRFLASPQYPTGAAGIEPGDFSILNDLGIDPATAENAGPALPASNYIGSGASVLGHDSFMPTRNFRDTRNFAKQNGIVFFPGSTPLYDNDGAGSLVGGFGVSGDGVDQDDVVTASGQIGYEAAVAIRADQFVVAGVRLPYQKFNRNPRG